MSAKKGMANRKAIKHFFLCIATPAKLYGFANKNKPFKNTSLKIVPSGKQASELSAEGVLHIHGSRYQKRQIATGHE